MNYLVHLYLAGEDPELQLGGLMGDFVKGPIPDSYPERISLGLHLHRRIDSLSQYSAHTRKSRQKLDQRYGHGRGIIVDIFYDHFLAANWEAFHHSPLSRYTRQTYALLQENFTDLPPGLQRIVPRMIEYDWLYSYQHPEVVGKALHRIAQRLSRPLPLEEATAELDQHKTSFRQDFEAFISEAKVFSCQETGKDLYRKLEP